MNKTHLSAPKIEHLPCANFYLWAHQLMWWAQLYLLVCSLSSWCGGFELASWCGECGPTSWWWFWSHQLVWWMGP